MNMISKSTHGLQEIVVYKESTPPIQYQINTTQGKSLKSHYYSCMLQWMVYLVFKLIMLMLGCSSNDCYIGHISANTTKALANTSTNLMDQYSPFGSQSLTSDSGTVATMKFMITVTAPKKLIPTVSIKA